MNNIMFRPMSDVHIESHPEGWRVPVLHGVPESEVVCLLAGDIVDRYTEKYDRFIRDLIERHYAVVHVPGNHEYYKSPVEKVDEHWLALADEFPSYFYASQDKPLSIEFGDVRVLACTLWTDLDNGNPLAMWHAQQYMNDYRLIRRQKGGDFVRWTPNDAMRVNALHQKFLEEELHKHHGGKVVVMTHHVPLFELRAYGKYAGSSHADPAAHSYYNTKLGNAVDRSGPNVWVFGHTHDVIDSQLLDTRFISNAAGYCNDAGPGVFQKLFEVNN